MPGRRSTPFADNLRSRAGLACAAAIALWAVLLLLTALFAESDVSRLL